MTKKDFVYIEGTKEKKLKLYIMYKWYENL